MTLSVKKKRKKKYTWEQIKTAIIIVYEESDSRDTWNLKSLHSNELIDSLKKKLKTTP